MAEELRLEASVVDKFSKPLRDLRDRLRDVKSPDSVKGMAGDFGKVESAVLGATRQIQGGLSQAMSGLGVTSLAATASVAGVISAVKGFSARTIELKQFARETGFTTQALKAMSDAASQFGVDGSIVEPALKKFADSLRDIKNKRPGSIYDELVRADPQLLRALAGKSANEALGIVEEQLAAMSKDLDGRENAGKIAGAMFGTDAMARFALRGISQWREVFKEIQKAGGPTDEAEDKAAAFEKANNELIKSFGKLKAAVGGTFAPTLTTAMDALNKFVTGNQDASVAVGETVAALLAARKVGLLGAGGMIGTGTALAAGTVAAGALAESSPDKATQDKMAEFYKNNPDKTGANATIFGYMGKAWREHAPTWAGGEDAGLLHKQSYTGSGGLLHNMSFGGGGGVSLGGLSFVDAVALGTHKGLLAAFRELRGEQDLDKKAGGGGGGFQEASYGGGGGGAHPAMRRAVQRAVSGLAAGKGALPDGLTAVAKSLPKEARAFLDDIASGEAKDYNVINGGSRFSSYAGHPFGTLSTNRGGRAAGRYQDLPSTWARIQRATGLKDFSPESQDKGNWWLAQQDYRAKTHRDLLRDLQSKNPAVIANIGRALRSTWTSLNGSFASKYQHYLERHHDRSGASALPRVPMPSNMPPPEDHGPQNFKTRGSLLRQHRDAEGDHRPRDPAEINVKFHNAPKVSIQADGGDHFGRINIDPGRTRMTDI